MKPLQNMRLSFRSLQWRVDGTSPHLRLFLAEGSTRNSNWSWHAAGSLPGPADPIKYQVGVGPTARTPRWSLRGMGTSAEPGLPPSEPMELKTEVKPQERRQRILGGLCIYCEGERHQVANCPRLNVQVEYSPAILSLTPESQSQCSVSIYFTYQHISPRSWFRRGLRVQSDGNCIWT